MTAENGTPRRDRRIPARPYRDAAVLYGILSVAILGLALLTGGSLVRAIVVAVGFWLLATGWSWWRFRQRIEAIEAERKAGS